MARPDSGTLIWYLRFMVASWKNDPRTDADLLAAFAHTHDETAFTTLVGRYGSLVWGICGRILDNPADAEDAFQATFLHLARKAPLLTRPLGLSGWLSGVAQQRALNVRKAVQRQRLRERQMIDLARRSTLDRAEMASLRAALEEELARLPEKYRIPLLCHREGQTVRQIAENLQRSLGDIARRLARGEELLRQRLKRQGMIVSAGALVVLLTRIATAATVPPRLMMATVQAARAFPTGGAGAVARSVLRAPALGGRWKMRLGLLLLAGVCSAGVGLAIRGSVNVSAAGQDKAATGAASQPSRDALPGRAAGLRLARLAPAPEAPAVAGRVFDADGKPVARAEIRLLPGHPPFPADMPASLARGQTDAKGRFRLALNGPLPKGFPKEDPPLTILAVSAAYGVGSWVQGAPPAAKKEDKPPQRKIVIGGEESLKGVRREEIGKEAAANYQVIFEELYSVLTAPGASERRAGDPVQIHLTPFGAAQIRFHDREGRPVDSAKLRPALKSLSPVLKQTKPPRGEALAVDAKAVLYVGPRQTERGCIEFRALVPGVTYAFVYQEQGEKTGRGDATRYVHVLLGAVPSGQMREMQVKGNAP